MAIAWFICPYKRDLTARRPTRYCAMNDFTPQILAEGGTWTESEVLGNYAVVKVRASATTLTTIAGTPDFTRIPNHIALSDQLGDLTNTQRNTLLTLLQNMGYPLAEISAALGGTLANWRTHTLGDVLRFITRRRQAPRYDAANDAIVLDGAIHACRDIANVDAEVQ